MFDLNTTVFLTTSMIWVIGAPVAFVLLGILFVRPSLNFVTSRMDRRRASVVNR